MVLERKRKTYEKEKKLHNVYRLSACLVSRTNLAYYACRDRNGAVVLELVLPDKRIQQLGRRGNNPAADSGRSSVVRRKSTARGAFQSSVRIKEG